LRVTPFLSVMIFPRLIMKSLKSAILTVCCVMTNNVGRILFLNGIAQNFIEQMLFFFARRGEG